MRYLKNSIITLLLIAVMVAQASAHGYGLDPLELKVYERCPQPVTFTARIGQVAGAIVGAPVGFVGGILYSPFNGFDVGESAMVGGLVGAFALATAGSAITGAPAYGIYRLFNWDGCK